MPRYLIQRNFGPIDDEQMGAVGRDSKHIISEHYPDIEWEVSHVVADDEGVITTFCIYTAPNEERILEHAAKLGRHNVDRIYEIGGQVSPADFPS